MRVSYAGGLLGSMFENNEQSGGGEGKGREGEIGHTKQLVTWQLQERHQLTP